MTKVIMNAGRGVYKVLEWRPELLKDLLTKMGDNFSIDTVFQKMMLPDKVPSSEIGNLDGGRRITRTATDGLAADLTALYLMGRNYASNHKREKVLLSDVKFNPGAEGYTTGYSISALVQLAQKP